MFVIPCKFVKEKPVIYDLVDDIRKYHEVETIVIVDSDSEDKSYFELENKYKNVIILDAKNKHYHTGGYWIAYDKYPDEEFYYFLHDSMRIKANLDYLKEKECTPFAYFVWYGQDHIAKDALIKFTKYNIPTNGLACYGPCFFVQNSMMKKLKSNNIDKILPTFSQHSNVRIGIGSYEMESVFGIAFTNEGINMQTDTLIGDITQKGINHLIPNYDSSWMYPIEKIILKRV